MDKGTLLKSAFSLALLAAGATALASSNLPGGASPKAPAASNASLTNVASFTDACNGVSYSATLTVTGTTDDGGGKDTVYFTIYDDSAIKYQTSFQVAVGQTASFPVFATYPGGIGTSAPGIGVYVTDTPGLNNTLLFADPFFPTVVPGCAIGQLAPQGAPAMTVWGIGTLILALGLIAAWWRRTQ